MKRLADSIATVSWPKLDGLKPSSFGMALLLFFAGSASANTPLDPAAVRMAADYSARHRGVSFLAIQNGRTLWILILASSQSFSCMKHNQATVTQRRFVGGWRRSQEARLFMDLLRFRYSIKC